MQPAHLEYIVDHVFLPPKLRGDHTSVTTAVNHSLVTVVLGIAKEYQSKLPGQVDRSRWEPMTKMLAILQKSTDSGGLSSSLIADSIDAMIGGDVTAFHIQAQNAAIIFRKLETEMIFELFEVMPTAEKLLNTKGKLICSFPGPAITVPLEIVCDNDFRDELASFLEQMDKEAPDDIVAAAKRDRDSAHPRYITQMLTGILRALGQPADVHRISKRVADECYAYNPWRRSPLWLVLRVALQTSFARGGDGLQYKAFMAFLMARILDLAAQNNLASDILHVMRVKMARRLYKIRSTVPSFVLNEVREVGEKVQTLLESRWSDVQQIHAKPWSWNPGELDVLADTSLSLDNSRPHISRSLKVRLSSPIAGEFNPVHSVRLTDASAFSQIQDGHFSRVGKEELFTALHDFEHIVQIHLDGWVSQHRNEASACQVLAQCITNYFDQAQNLYKSNPEDLSLMLLTVLELWVAIDKIATEQIPLLKEYSPEVNVSVLETLLLRKSEQRDRFALLETHLRRRHNHKRAGLPSIFSDVVTVDTFPFRYFEGSEEHKSLKLDIEEDAKKRREEKLEELERSTAQYNQLDTEAETLDHTWEDGIHVGNCRKCLLERQRNSLSIYIHEWPLPNRHMDAKAVVFELRCPVAFGVWRSTTRQVLRDVLSPPPTNHISATVRASLKDYQGLKNYARNLQRISWASYTESYLSSPCNPAKLPVPNPEIICLENKLSYRLLDSQKHEWALDYYNQCSITHYCKMQLSTGPYRVLQFAVDGTSHTSNMVLSGQSNCPKELSIHEYLAFGNLRAGHRLQWLNILRELRARSLTFRHEDVFTLLAQTVWEVGPSLPSTGERESHSELKTSEFGVSLLDELDMLLDSAEANWLELVTVMSIVILASQLLSAASHGDVVERVYSLLRRARNATLGWMRQLIKKCHANEDELEVQHLQQRACETAAVCRSTYDVDGQHIAQLVCGDDDVAIVIECAIVIHNNADLAKASQSTKLLLDRDRRLAHVLEPILAERIGQSRHGIDKGIAAVWPFYKKGTSWMRVHGPNHRWFTSEAAPMADDRPLCIQFNVLEGEMLVGGAPFGRLPNQITKHETYTRIFGQRVLDVIPATVSGMQFSTRFLVSSYEVSFRYNNDDEELVIKARRQNDDTILELIPHKKFMGDIPQLLVEEYAHWLNPLNCEIELRPLETMWQPSPKNWRIRFSPNVDSIMVLGTSSLRLIDVRSRTFKMISSVLSSLESPEFLTTTLTMGNDLVADLPRFKLSFFLNDAKLLECRQLSGLVVDEKQCIGTMIGLHSRLVLRSPQPEDNPHRCVIIPHGKLQWALSGHHVSVKVDTGSQRQVRYQKYQVDDMLGRLVGNATLMSRLFKVYLHAVSAHVLPDPLTRRTGTEEALNDLQSAGCRSCQPLSTAETEILTCIGSLTPSRDFPRSYSGIMERVGWASLAPTSQHYGFYAHTKSIIEDAQRFGIFQDEPLVYKFRSDSQLLLERAALRHSIYYSAEFAGIRPSSKMDAIYHARHATDSVDRECLVWKTVQTIRCWPSRLDIHCDVLKTFRLWRKLEGPQHALPLHYDHKWLRPQLATKWLSIYDSLRKRSDGNRYALMFFFSAIAYGSPETQKFIHVMLAFAIAPAFRHLDLPPYPLYDLADGTMPRGDILLTIAQRSACPFESSPHALSSSRDRESHGTHCSDYQSHLESDCQAFVDGLINQWPCEEPNVPDRSKFPHLHIPETTVDRIKVLFRSWYRNWKLESHAKLIQTELDRFHCSNPGVAPSTYRFTPSLCIDPSNVLINMSDLLRRPVPTLRPVPSPPAALTVGIGHRVPDISPEAFKLLFLVSRFQGSPNGFRRLYGGDLAESCRALTEQGMSPVPSEISSSTMQAVTEYRNHCQSYVEEMLSSLIASLTAAYSPVEDVMIMAGIWPTITTMSLLAQLDLSARANLTSEWTRALVSFAEGIISLQCSLRMLGYAMRGETAEFFREVENIGVNRWDTTSNPDSLLIQIEGNFRLRHLQAEIALQMMTPSSGENTVLQLNMGEGKSSVITPIVAAALADSTKLVRVVVLKPLATQMLQILVQRLGGLTNRRIFYMPFSRSIQIGENEIKVIQGMYEECMSGGGILLTQPEHILSFKLMGIERSLSQDSHVGDVLLKSQLWLDDKTRDILDESDEILHVRYQLIYSIGARRPLEHHPDRWTTIQQVFSLVRKHAPDVQKVSKFGMEIRDDRRHGAFPYIRILQDDAAAELVSLVARDIYTSSLPNISFHRYPKRFPDMALNFITNKTIPDDIVKLIKHQCDESAGDWSTLLLLRGLLAHEILTFILKEKRWRVDYGLDFSRTLLAVPYRAKDCPSLSSEFGHPEVAIALTCLSYYYSGLSEEQLDLCFERLLMLDNSSLEYKKWLRNIDAPQDLQQLNGVNMKDIDQRQDYLVPLFQANQSVIDFFLNQVVFPSEAKEFPHKMTSSGWDIAQRKPQHVSTGFSGTNDSRYLLPLSISQGDSTLVASTNAKVLGYLLLPENSNYMCAKDDHGNKLSAQAFLTLIAAQMPSIRVLLDVGAQMLELRNKDLCTEWLSLIPDAQAAIFFNENDRLSVVTRDGTVESFISSPFSQQLDQCLVYLDNAHTRGTDLKLPLNFRAAVALGPKLTTTHLTQCCMRMRKLGQGHSLMFFAPPEVDHRIREAGSNSGCVAVPDILRWVMSETCADIQHHLPHWACQGMDYQTRHIPWRNFRSGKLPGHKLAKAWLRPEEKTLETLYIEQNRDVPFESRLLEMAPEIQEQCRRLGVKSLEMLKMDEEQEREVEQEVQNEHQIERPAKTTPVAHVVHQDVKDFVRMGTIPMTTDAITPAFSTLAQTSAVPPSSNSVWSPRLFATADFSRTIEVEHSNAIDDYLRPVHWILSSRTRPESDWTLVIISPHEANELLPDIRRSSSVQLHMYTPKVMQVMKAADDLKFYNIPSSGLIPWSEPLAIQLNQLNLFAGQLYLKDYSAYKDLCSFLGILATELSTEDNRVQRDGFIEHDPDDPPTPGRFQTSPLPFLKELFGLRRKGQSYFTTHLGKILHSRVLTEKDFAL